MVASGAQWPQWWEWELDCSNPHLAKRMVDRSLNEADLRAILQAATGYRADSISGRWMIESTHAHEPWIVIVEPDELLKLLVVVTVYPVR